MVNYKVTNYTADISDIYNLYADVIETQTGNVIKSGMSVDAARELCRSLNFGKGFDGWTPAFFLQKSGKVYFSADERV